MMACIEEGIAKKVDTTFRNTRNSLSHTVGCMRLRTRWLRVFACSFVLVVCFLASVNFDKLSKPPPTLQSIPPSHALPPPTLQSDRSIILRDRVVQTTKKAPMGYWRGAKGADVSSMSIDKLMVAKQQPAQSWQSFPNVWLPTYYQMAYANNEAREPHDLEKVKQTCIKLGCVAVTVEQNGWLAYFRNIPLDKSKWLPKPRSTMWVMSKYLISTTKQPDMKYGCSRHAHACRHNPEPGTAPCCAHVMLEIMSDMSRILRKYNIHWRLTQGQQLSVARDGIVQLWDHDFDPNFDQLERAKEIIEKEMHLSGKASKYRESDYFYTKRVSMRLKTDWSKYKVMGGDFNWDLKEFHDPYVLQRNPTFMDVGQNKDPPPTAETSFPCLPGYDILCSKRWFEEAVNKFHNGYQRPPSDMPPDQILYSDYESMRNLDGNLMFDGKGNERNLQSRADIIEKYVSSCPTFWEKPCLRK